MCDSRHPHPLRKHQKNSCIQSGRERKNIRLLAYILELTVEYTIAMEQPMRSAEKKSFIELLSQTQPPE